MISITNKIRDLLSETNLLNSDKQLPIGVKHEFEIRFHIKEKVFVDKILKDEFSIDNYRYQSRENHVDFAKKLTSKDNNTQFPVLIDVFTDQQEKYKFEENKPKIRIRKQQNSEIDVEFLKKEQLTHFRYPEPNEHITEYESDKHKYIFHVIQYLAKNSQIFRNNPSYYTSHKKIESKFHFEQPREEIEKHMKNSRKLLRQIDYFIKEKNPDPLEVLDLRDFTNYATKKMERSYVDEIIDNFKSSADIKKLTELKKFLTSSSKHVKQLEKDSLKDKIQGIRDYLFYYNKELFNIFEEDMKTLDKSYDKIVYEMNILFKKNEFKNRINKYPLKFPGNFTIYMIDKQMIGHPFMSINISKETELNMTQNLKTFKEIDNQKAIPKIRIKKQIPNTNWELSLTDTFGKERDRNTHKYLLEIEYINKGDARRIKVTEPRNQDKMTATNKNPIGNDKYDISADTSDLLSFLFENKTFSNYYSSQVCNHIRLRESPCIQQYREQNLFPRDEIWDYEKHHTKYMREIKYNRPYDLSFDNDTNSKFNNFKHLLNNKYAVTDKADGIRRFLITTVNGLVFLTNGKYDSYKKEKINAATEFTNMLSKLPGTILDGEYIQNTKTFYAFDILYYNFKDLTDLPLYQRHFWLSMAMDNLSTRISAKTFYYPEEFKNKIDTFIPYIGYTSVNTKHKDKIFQYYTGNIFKKADEVWNSKDHKYNLDGIIMSPIEENYNGKINFKNCNKNYTLDNSFRPHLKWKESPSIDVKLSNYNFQGTNYNNLIFVNQDRTTLPTSIDKEDLFENGKPKEFPVDFETNTETDIIKDGDIVELIYKENKWIPISIRKSKDKPNAINTINNIYHIIHNKYNDLSVLEDLYSKKSKNEITFSDLPVVFDIEEIDSEECILHAGKIEITIKDPKICQSDSIIAIVDYKDGKFVFDKQIHLTEHQTLRAFRSKYRDNPKKLILLTKEGKIKKKEVDTEEHVNPKSQYDPAANIVTERIGAMKYNNFTKNIAYSMALELINNHTQKKPKFLLEYAAGKGGDIASWYQDGDGFTHVLAIDESYESIYGEKGLASRYKNGKWDKNKFKVTYVHGDINKPLDSCGIGQQENDKIKAFLNQEEFNGEFHLISCQFAIHYVKNLNSFMNENVLPYMMPEIGMFIYTYIDVKPILKELEEKDVLFKYKSKTGNYVDFYKISKDGDKLKVNNIKWGMDSKPFEENMFNQNKIEEIEEVVDGFNTIQIDKEYYHQGSVPDCFSNNELSQSELNHEHRTNDIIVSNSLGFMELTNLGVVYSKELEEDQLMNSVEGVYEKSITYFPECRKNKMKRDKSVSKTKAKTPIKPKVEEDHNIFEDAEVIEESIQTQEISDVSESEEEDNIEEIIMNILKNSTKEELGGKDRTMNTIIAFVKKELKTNHGRDNVEKDTMKKTIKEWRKNKKKK